MGDLDDFLAERLNPITLRGNGSTAALHDSPSKASQTKTGFETQSKHSSEISLSVKGSSSSSTFASPQIPAPESSSKTTTPVQAYENKSGRTGLSGLAAFSAKKTLKCRCKTIVSVWSLWLRTFSRSWLKDWKSMHMTLFSMTSWTHHPLT